MNIRTCSPLRRDRDRAVFGFCFAVIRVAFLFLVLVALAGTADASQAQETGCPRQVILQGDVPSDDFPTIQRRSDRIWSYLTHRLNLPARHCRPTVYFHPFDRDVQSPAWTAWQKEWTRTHPMIWRDWTALRENGPRIDVSREWIDSNIDRILPFPRSFLAFHYAGTNRIQMNPSRTFRASIRLDRDGRPYDVDGRGYYSMAHEMLHYALELKGVVPAKLHHCLMLQVSPDQEGAGLMELVANDLVESGTITAGAGFRGLRTERIFSPCTRLTAEEQLKVRSYRARLQADPRG